jgi:hypothetical protein
MRIDRPALLAQLREFASAGDGLVVGRPGIGKTFALAELAKQLEEEGRDCLMIPVADLGSASEDEVKRALYLDAPLVDQLRREFQPSETPALIIIDAFDAARDPVVRARVLGLIRELIQEANGAWNLIVSVRSFDATKSPELLALFPAGGSPPPRGLASKTRTFSIPPLSDDEVTAASRQIPGLSALLPSISPELGGLLRIPFNLWLAEAILSSGGSASLPDTNTELQLLDVFWEHRVTRTPQGLRRTAIADHLTARMVQDRTLVVPVSVTSRTEWESELHALLSDEVLQLTGAAQEQIAFGHQILFDYAVSVYRLQPRPGVVAEFLAAEPSRALFLRPSLVYFYERLWSSDRGAFWRAFWEIRQVEDVAVSLIARIVPPTVVVRSTGTLADLSDLLSAPGRSASERATAVLTVLHAVRFASAEAQQPWPTFVEELSRNPHEGFAWEACSLLHRTLAAAHTPDSDVPGIAGRAARQFLSWVLDERKQSPHRPWLDALGANVVVPLVLQTFDTDPQHSAELVREVLALIEEVDFEIRYFFSIAQGIESIVAADPGLAADVYRRLFLHVEVSTAPTAMGTPILRLQGNRRQDFGMCHYALAKAFPVFLEKAPAEAIAAGLDAFEAEVLREHIMPYTSDDADVELAERLRSFQFRGAATGVIEDHSWIWGSSPHRSDEMQMLDAIRASLEKEARVDDPDAVADGRMDAMLDAFAVRPRTGAVWAALLAAGAATSRLQDALKELAVCPPLMLSTSTRQAVGRYIAASVDGWPKDWRLRVEAEILSLPSGQWGEPEEGERARDALLLYFPEGTLLSGPAKDAAASLREGGKELDDEHPFRIQTWSKQYTTEDWLEERGVETQSPANASLLSQTNPLREFSTEWSNKKPAWEEVAPLLDQTVSLREALDASTTAAEEVIEQGWTALAGAAETLIRSGPDPASDAWRTLRRILLDASERAIDDPPADVEETFTSPFWSPSARTEAIQGLSHLLWAQADDAAATRLRMIAATDPWPSHRYLVVRYAPMWLRQMPSDFWSLVEEVAATEKQPVVLAALAETLSHSARHNAERTLAVLRGLIDDRELPDSRDLIRPVALLLTYFVVVEQDDWSSRFLDSVLAQPLAHESLTAEVVFFAYDYLVPRGSDREKARRAAALISKAIDGLADEDARLRAKEDAGSDRGRVHQLAERAIDRLYYSALRDGDESDQQPDRERLRSYHEAAGPVLEAISRFTDPSHSGFMLASAAYSLIRYLNAVVDVDPRTALRVAAHVVRASESSGFNLDKMAVGEVVRLMETLLADHRDVLLAPAALTDAIGMLDSFARAGWPEAMQLVWGLDEVFR